MMFGLITKREHDEIVAGYQNDVRQAEKAYEGMRWKWQAEMAEKVRAMLLAADRAKAIRRLEARLAVFTAPRPRGPGGRFLSTRPVGEMGEGGL